MARGPWHARTNEQYQVFDGKSFIPYRYTKAVAVALATERAALHRCATQVLRHTSSGMVVVATVNP